MGELLGGWSALPGPPHPPSLAALIPTRPNSAVQAPQWVVDAAGADWLLLPIMHPQPADVEAGVLVLAPLAGVAHALEAEGSRLSPSLLLNLSHQASGRAI